VPILKNNVGCGGLKVDFINTFNHFKQKDSAPNDSNRILVPILKSNMGCGGVKVDFVTVNFIFK